jgi:hypothetical protein
VYQANFIYAGYECWIDLPAWRSCKDHPLFI